MTHKIPVCKYGAEECFALNAGHCLCLDSMPNTKVCPFFKRFYEVDQITKLLIKKAK